MAELLETNRQTGDWNVTNVCVWVGVGLVRVGVGVGGWGGGVGGRGAG